MSVKNHHICKYIYTYVYIPMYRAASTSLPTLPVYPLDQAILSNPRTMAEPPYRKKDFFSFLFAVFNRIISFVSTNPSERLTIKNALPSFVSIFDLTKLLPLCTTLNVKMEIYKMYIIYRNTWARYRNIYKGLKV